MQLAAPDLVVGRDRAHVKALIEEFPRSEVVSASAFFDKVRILAFVKDEALIRDDYASTLFAKNCLAKDRRFSQRLAPAFSSLFSACYHGTSSPIDVWAEISRDDYEFGPVFEILAAVDRAMRDANLVNGVSALYRSWLIIKNHRVLPLGLRNKRMIHLRHLVDLTSLEIEVIKDLSRLQIDFSVCFPLDFQKRGINTAVDFSAKLFEKSQDLTNIDLSFDNIAHPGPLRPLVEALFVEDGRVEMSETNCQIKTPSDIVDEAQQIGSKIAEILTNTPDASIAVALRSMDSRAKIYKNILVGFGIGVRDRKGVPLLETDSGLLLVTLLLAKTGGLSHRHINALINHPRFAHYVGDMQKRSGILACVARIGIDDHVKTTHDRNYRVALENLRAKKDLSDRSEDDLDHCEDWLKSVEDFLDLLPMKASFLGFFEKLSLLIERAINNDDGNVSILTSSLAQLHTSARRVDPYCPPRSEPYCHPRARPEDDIGEMDFSEFSALVLAELARITVPRPDIADVNAVEFLLLPELLGRRFDHVFIADISFGRMPQNSQPDPLIDDQARIAVNRVLKKTLLRVFFDDPFEPLPVPPRQALEPFWFASAIASARTSVHFSCARHDEDGREQAPSEFFLWLDDHVHLANITPSSTATSLIRPVDLRFLRGISERNTAQEPQTTFHKTLVARKNAFSQQVTSAMAFDFPAGLVLKHFDGRLSLQPTKALTPTMIEAFAECRFKGWAERFLAIGFNDQDEDIDARILGQIAHRTLELYFSRPEHKIHHDPDQRRIRDLAALVGREYQDRHFVLNAEVFLCHIEALSDALFALIYRMSQESLSSNQRVVALELAFGLSGSEWPPLAIDVKGRRYLLAGRVDRVDQAEDQLLVIDYKLSSIAALRSELTEKNILLRHFQMPVYWRLVARYLAQGDPLKVGFSFASIRDGQSLALRARNPSLVDRVFNDADQNGLAEAIDRIFAPIMDGKIVATKGEHCTTCDLAFVCRKAEGESCV
ncbi:MAG TPA: PD-(D/E)XK nuclease family protein [Myxococcota bacterium]|nr:PD-(D/E)XK nuclease family protein [Myxococcota bacterium]